MALSKKDLGDTTAWRLFITGLPEIADLPDDKHIFGPDDVEVIVVANGVKLDFEKMVEMWERHIESEINKRASQEVTNKSGDIYELLSELDSEIRRICAKRFNISDWNLD